MPLPETVRFLVDKLVGPYCHNKVPPHAIHQVRVEYGVRGNAVTIFERRAPWRADLGPDWSKMPIAQMRYDIDSKTWSLWWADRNGRWLPYRAFTASTDMKKALRQLEEDQTGAFWG